jgi:Hypervirulence associated proteins TUDOR domain
MIRHKKKSLPPGSRVVWNGEGPKTEGVIRKVFTHRLERTMKGSIVTHDACRQNPAYLIEQDDGDTLLKNHSDLKRVA